ncbi:ATP-dependent zinc protease [Candidatus Saccharibacteria bacterium]|nr:ATP-dependent zinc protease [Candidatus Saccharibacteria bacterium]
MKTEKKSHKVIIGRAEEITFVNFSDEKIPAKTDTGAYRSAVHADNIKIDDAGTLHSRILGGHPVFNDMAFEVETNDYDVVHIANSFGDREDRYEVKLRVKVGGHIFTTPFTLADRSKNVYPVLLGRLMLNNRFLVDTSQSDINRTELKRKYKINFVPDEENGRPAKGE